MASLIYTTDHLNLKVSILCMDSASFKIEISKVQDFRNFELPPIEIKFYHMSTIDFCMWLVELLYFLGS